MRKLMRSIKEFFKSVSAVFGGFRRGRGFTGHEHIRQFNLINMNARLYDTRIGRFLSPDNYITDPENPQSYNRYSYVLNNPLKYVDPTGNYGYIPYQGQFDGVDNGISSFNGDYIESNSIDFDMSSADLWVLIFGSIDGYYRFGDKYKALEEFAYGQLSDNIFEVYRAGEWFRMTGGRLPEDAKIEGSCTVEEEEIIQLQYDADRAKFEAAYPDYGLPLGTVIIFASGRDIAFFSANHKDKEFLTGLSKWSKKEIWLNSEISLQRSYKEYGWEDHKYKRDDNWRGQQYTTLEVLTHEIGHFQGYIQHLNYKDWSDIDKENQARQFTNILRAKYGFPLEYIER